MLDRIALALLIIGGLNWGGGGQSGVVSRIIYILVALAAIWCVTLFFRDARDTFFDEPTHSAT